jgi:glycerate kinase
MPLADGGDGTLEVMLTQTGSQRRSLTVNGPLGEPVTADYGLLADGETAVIEMALASGLALLGDLRDPLRASTFGTGQLMRDAIQHGARRLIVGVGGSATNDGGAGCLQALGVTFVDADGRPIKPEGGSLNQLARVGKSPLLDGIDIRVLCDVTNPPLGADGASAIFGPQKGASPQMVTQLDANLAHFFGVIADQTGVDVRELPGGGAAGALAGGLAALAGATLVPGAETLIEFLGYDEKIAACDLIVTGEGQLDAQTGHGKAPAVIAARAASVHVPTIAIAGSISPDADALAGGDIVAAFSLVPGPVALEEAVHNADEWLTASARNLGNLLANWYNRLLGLVFDTMWRLDPIPIPSPKRRREQSRITRDVFPPLLGEGQQGGVKSRQDNF